MVIRRSSAAEIEALLADLDGKSEVRREAAVARLALIGARAVDRLTAVLVEPRTAGGRVPALWALEAIGDIRALEPALACLDDPDGEVSTAAAAVVRNCLKSDPGTKALERLTDLATDVAKPGQARLLAIDALSELPQKTIEPVLRRLAADPDQAIRARAAAARRGAPRRPARPSGLAVLDEALGGRLPSEPARLRHLVAEHAHDVPLPGLHRLIEAIRRREAATRDPAVHQAWTAVRASVHQALALRGSNVALYDLRDTIERAEGPVAVEFLSALAAIGDETCLEPIVMAYARSAGPAGTTTGDWWQSHLADTFRHIVKRERLTGRHSAIRRIRSRWPGAAAELLEPKRKRGTSSRPAPPANDLLIPEPE